MAVGDFEREFMAAAAAQGIELESAVRFPWLSGLGHAEPEAQSAPCPLLEQVAALHNALGGADSKLREKRRRLLAVDFTLSGRIIVELDEFQHFTSSRLTSLDYYDDFDHDLDIPTYRKLCTRTWPMRTRTAGPRSPRIFHSRVAEPRNVRTSTLAAISSALPSGIASFASRHQQAV